MRRRKSHDAFSSEDRVLWKRVADTIIPLSRRRGKELAEEMKALLGEASDKAPLTTAGPPTVSRSPKPESYRPPQPPRHPTSPGPQHSHPIEERVAKNLAKGRLAIDSRIDLHGMTQDRARFALLDFLQMAQQADHRIVLVITGKGNEGQGVLRRYVPEWLNLPQFSKLVNGYRTSHISHGGDGALYVRIKKPAHKANRT